MKPAVILFSAASVSVGEKIAGATGGSVHAIRGRIDTADAQVDSAVTHIRDLFQAGTPIIAVMAAGALIRILAPVLNDKKNEPPVIAVSENGKSIVPLLGGHHGANDLARLIAGVLGGHSAVTTAGDLRFGIALDEPPQGHILANPQNAKSVMTALLNGEAAHIEGDASWLQQSNVPRSDTGAVRLIVSDKPVKPGALDLVYHPKTLALGIGCERGCDPGDVLVLARSALAKGGFCEQSVAVVVSLDVKADEPAIHHVAAHFRCPARFFEAPVLEAETPRLQNPSEAVFAEVGCHGVAEGAALAAVGQGGELVVAKLKSARATAAVARSQAPLLETGLAGLARGNLFVIGLGPGQEDWRSPEASRLVGKATDLVGYSLYLDLLGPAAAGKVRHDFGLGDEEERVRRAMELAGEGRDVALVCSGDAGIYAMATLVFELLDRRGVSAAAQRVGITVSPGISALQAAAARAGAPLGHDFCTISLSDLLTPWDAIKTRVKAAAEGDFVIAFYNPVSRKRRTQLAHARDVLLHHRPPDTPVVLATNLGRDGETVRVVPLVDLNIDDVDMLTVVIAGSSQSRVVKTGDGKCWTYTPRGYSAKAGSAMNKDAAE